MASSPSVEVQLLLAAEKRATDKVSDARKRKAQRLKKAKEEAAEEIEQFKTEKQISYNQYETDHIGTKDDIAKRIERETNEKVSQLDERMSKTKSLVLDQLINHVVTAVDARLHRNKKSMMSVA